MSRCTCCGDTGTSGSQHEMWCPAWDIHTQLPTVFPAWWGQVEQKKEESHSPERIYLEPSPGTGEYGQMWCEEPIEDDWVEYVRADTVECDHPNPVTDKLVEWCPACSSVVRLRSLTEIVE